MKRYTDYFYLVLMTLLSVYLLSSCTYSAVGTKNIGKRSLYDRVIQSGKIRCAYLIYPPGCSKDPNTGKISGIGVEAVELVAKKLGLQVEWVEEIGWSTMLEGLNTRRYDLIATPVWTNANRAKVVSFSKPLFYSPVFVFARKGDKRFKSHWEQINSANVKIATIDGGTVEVIAAADFPKAGRLAMPELTDISQLLLNVASGKADITFAESTVADRYIHNNPGTVESINPEKPVRIFSSCWMFNRGEFEFKEMLDTVLDEVVNSGAMDKIISKYEQVPNEVYRVSLPYQLPK